MTSRGWFVSGGCRVIETGADTARHDGELDVIIDDPTGLFAPSALGSWDDQGPARGHGSEALEHAQTMGAQVGSRSLDRQEANLFLRLVRDRYEKGPFILMSSKNFRDWPEIFAGDETQSSCPTWPLAGSDSDR